MSIIKNPSQKEEPQPGAIYECNLRPSIGLITGMPTVVSSDNSWERHNVAHIRSDHLKHEVFDVPVDQLIDLWVCRFGNDWISLTEIAQDDFYKLAYTRLKQIGELEVHYLSDRAEYTCRVPK